MTIEDAAKISDQLRSVFNDVTVVMKGDRLCVVGKEHTRMIATPRVFIPIGKHVPARKIRFR